MPQSMGSRYIKKLRRPVEAHKHTEKEWTLALNATTHIHTHVFITHRGRSLDDSRKG